MIGKQPKKTRKPKKSTGGRLVDSILNGVGTVLTGGAIGLPSRARQKLRFRYRVDGDKLYIYVTPESDAANIRKDFATFGKCYSRAGKALLIEKRAVGRKLSGAVEKE